MGDFGDYKEVLEIALGLETYSPSECKAVHTVKITAYINDNATELELVSLVEKLLKNHPWEQPVMTVWCRNFRLFSKSKPQDFLLDLKSRLQTRDK